MIIDSKNPPLWDHQKLAIERAKDTNFAFLFDPGTGKTRTTIETILKSGPNQRVLVLAPLIVLQNWKHEWIRFGGKFGQDPVLVTGAKVARILAIEKAIKKNLNILIANYEALATEEIFSGILKFKPTVLVVDESSRVKDPKSKRTKLVRKLSELIPRRYLLTGTPVTNSLMDVYSQWDILDHGETFGDSFFVFRAKYFQDLNAYMNRQNYFPNWVVRPDKMEQVYSLMAAKSMVVNKDEVLDLPPLLRVPIYLEMPPEQRRIYEELKRDFLVWLTAEKQVVTSLVIVKLLRCIQITSGYAQYSDDDANKQDYTFKEHAKAWALEELLSDLQPKKCVIWACFKQNYKTIREICEKLKISCEDVHGGVSDKEKHEAIERFKTTPNPRVLICHPGSVGIGINLQVADCMIYYSKNFTLEHDIQSEARCYRAGSEIHKKITRYDLVCVDSVDDDIHQALESKLKFSMSFLKSIKELS